MNTRPSFHNCGRLVGAGQQCLPCTHQDAQDTLLGLAVIRATQQEAVVPGAPQEGVYPATVTEVGAELRQRLLDAGFKIVEAGS